MKKAKQPGRRTAPAARKRTTPAPRPAPRRPADSRQGILFEDNKESNNPEPPQYGDYPD